MRVQTRAELIRLHRKLGVTTIYVTHDQVEAMTMGQRVAVMRDGLLQQCDTPANVYRSPANRFVAGFIGTPPMNFIPGHVTEDGPVGVCLDSDVVIPIPEDRSAALAGRRGHKVELGVRPEDIDLRTPGKDAPGFSATVEVIEPMGANDTVYLGLGPSSVIATLPPGLPITEGEASEFVVNTDRAHVFDVETEVALV
jgi:multiple sugar transport system ATP-binding protein